MIPWTTEGMPERCWLTQRRRTRDSSHLRIRESAYCALIFWKAPSRSGFDSLLVDWLTGLSGAHSAGADFSHTCGDESWIVTSHEITSPQWRIDGPHFAPISACHRPAWARIDVSPFVDAERLRHEIESLVSQKSIRHRGLDPVGYLLGITRHDRVTCSGLIGGAILRQRESPFAQALLQALRARFTYGEITPADLARAAAILGLVPEGETHPVVTLPVIARGRLSWLAPRRVPS